jgi:hypothetical protein
MESRAQQERAKTRKKERAVNEIRRAKKALLFLLDNFEFFERAVRFYKMYGTGEAGVE